MENRNIKQKYSNGWCGKVKKKPKAIWKRKARRQSEPSRGGKREARKRGAERRPEMLIRCSSV